MTLFGLALVGATAPTAVPAILPSGLRLPRIYTELHRQWGSGSIGGEFQLHPVAVIDQYSAVYEREVEIDPELAHRSPVAGMRLDEWKGLASFAFRDRLELAWVRGHEEDGPLWAIDVSASRFSRVGSFAELPRLLDQIELEAPPGPGLRWGFPHTFVTTSASARVVDYEAAIDGDVAAASTALDTWETIASAYTIYASSIDRLRSGGDTSDRGGAVLRLLEQRAIEKLGRIPV